MQPDLRCYYHPDREAGGQCDRCGDYLCVPCVREHEELQVCPRCLSDLTRPKLPELPKLIRDASLFNLAAIVVVIPCLMMGMDGLALLAVSELCIVAWAVALAVGGWSEKRDAAWRLQVSVLLLSCLPPVFFVGCLLVVILEPSSMLITILIPCLATGGLFLLSFAFWLAAVSKGVRPLWVVVVSLVTMVGWLALVGAGAPMVW